MARPGDEMAGECDDRQPLQGEDDHEEPAVAEARLKGRCQRQMSLESAHMASDLIACDRDRQGFLGQPGTTPGERPCSEQTALAIDTAVRAIVDAAFATAVGVLQTTRDFLERSARLLLDKETLDEHELAALGRPASPVAVASA